MDAAALSIDDSIGFGWRTFKARPGLFVGATFIIIALSTIIGGTVGSVASHWGTAASAASSNIVSLIVNTFIGMGTTAFYLKAHDNITTVRLRDLWHPSLFWSFLGLSLLEGIAVLAGLVLFIVPGIILAVMFMFGCYLVIDRRLTPIKALKESARMTKGHRWNLFLLLLVIIALNIVGLLALAIGLLVTVPLSILAVVHAYRTLEEPAAASAI